MNKLFQRLKSRKNDIKVVIIGLGAMGKGLYYQCTITPGVKCIAVADLDVNKCIDAAQLFNDSYKVVSNEPDLYDAVNHNRVALCDDGMLLSKCIQADIVIEASNAIGEGAKFVISALENKKHVVLMNAEIDLLYGVYFMQVARENNVICTSIDGDQYGVIKRVIDDFELWGFEPVMAGNIKGYLDRYANPTGIMAEADKRNLDYRMCTSYTDGTKLCIEMSIIANAFGMKTLATGMKGPRANHVSEVFSLFDFEKIWQEDKTPFVDYILGSEPGGGVFAVGYSDHPYQRSMMEYYKMGKGPFYLFYRPYHLCHVEAIQSTVAPFLDNEALLQPQLGFQTNVFTYAKKDLKQGEELDGLGGYTCYGLIENCTETNEKNSLPVLLADEVKLKRDIEKDKEITFDDIEYDPNSYAFDLYFKALKVSDYIKKNNTRKEQKFSFPRIPALGLKFWK
ncbi:MAG: homoserine dehydrogenase [Fulvivirga sp.]